MGIYSDFTISSLSFIWNNSFCPLHKHCLPITETCPLPVFYSTWFHTILYQINAWYSLNIWYVICDLYVICCLIPVWCCNVPWTAWHPIDHDDRIVYTFFVTRKLWPRYPCEERRCVYNDISITTLHRVVHCTGPLSGAPKVLPAVSLLVCNF